MMTLDETPASIRGWFAAEKSANPKEALRAVLAPDVVFDFGGRKVHGVDAVVSTVTMMMPPGWLGDVAWNLLTPAPGATQVTVRGISATGTVLPSPGGPMDFIDFTFALEPGGLITQIVPQPHHLEPSGLGPPLRPGDVAPDFVLPDVNGAKVSLRQEGATVTVVVFTCNHCPFSLGWHDRVQQVGRDYAARGVRLLQINPNDPAVNPKDGADYSRRRFAEGGFAGPYLIDEGQVVARRWGARHTPEVFVLDANGVVAYHGAPDADVGDESLHASWLRGTLDHVLSGGLPAPAETPPVGCSIKWTMP